LTCDYLALQLGHGQKAENRIFLGKRGRKPFLNHPVSYTYDNLYRLSQATNPLPSTTNEIFTYDPVGNRLTKTGQGTPSVFNNANRLTEDQEFTYVYDNNGNLTSKTNKSTSQVTTYIYDAENQLTQVNKTGMSATYSYDGLGRRIEKNVNGVKTKYVYNGEDIIREFDLGGNLLARYVHGPGIDEPLIMERGGQSYFYQVDGLGSNTDLSNSSGGVAQSYVYDSFGQIASQSGTLTNPYTYTGRELDSESGLYYYRARYYDANIGRFIQEDPIGFNGGVNFYTYVRNNPINNTDPNGLLPKGTCCIGGLEGVWEGAASRFASLICRCYWLCVPPQGTYWRGNWFALPATWGVLTSSRGGGVRRGNACLCQDPAGVPQTLPLTLFEPR